MHSIKCSNVMICESDGCLTKDVKSAGEEMTYEQVFS